MKDYIVEWVNYQVDVNPGLVLFNYTVFFTAVGFVIGVVIF